MIVLVPNVRPTPQTSGIASDVPERPFLWFMGRAEALAKLQKRVSVGDSAVIKNGKQIP